MHAKINLDRPTPLGVEHMQGDQSLNVKVGRSLLSQNKLLSAGLVTLPIAFLGSASTTLIFFGTL